MSLNSSRVAEKFQSTVSSETQGKFLAVKPYKTKKLSTAITQCHKVSILISQLRNRKTERNQSRQDLKPME